MGQNNNMKTITTGTKITFKETGDKFTLTQTETGFDVKQVKLSKNIPHEPYTFQELLDLYESGQITIEGFEEGDAGLIHSILTNYIYQANLKDKLAEIETFKSQIEYLKSQLTKISELENIIAEKDTKIETLETTIGAMKDEEEEEEIQK